MFTFFAGSNAVEFVKQYAQAGLKERVPLYGSAYLTDSTLLAAQGAASDGVITSGHWAPSLDNDATKKFLAEFKQGTGKDGDLNSMHGHDTLEVIAMGLEATKGSVNDKPALSQALQKVEFQSPRWPLRFAQETRSRTSMQSRPRAVICASWKRCKPTWKTLPPSAGPDPKSGRGRSAADVIPVCPGRTASRPHAHRL